MSTPAVPKRPERPGVPCFLDAGPFNGPRHLPDSNIDGGQDFFASERWCRCFRRFTPQKGLGYTVHIYHLTREDIDTVFPEGFAAEEEKLRE